MSLLPDAKSLPLTPPHGFVLSLRPGGNRAIALTGRQGLKQDSYLPSGAGRLLAARFLRSLAQGGLVVDFALYLHHLGWSGTEIGFLTTASFLVGSLLSLAVGALADRFGYRGMLLGYEFCLAVVFLGAMLSTGVLVVSVGAVLGGFGRGANGAPGCFVPAELAWLAELVSPAHRAAVYNLNTAAGLVGMALGAAGAAFAFGLTHGHPAEAPYRVMFMVGAALSIGNAMLILAVPKTRAGSQAAGGIRGRRSASGGSALRLTSAERRSVLRLGAVNILDGVAVGLSGPLAAYWFALRFGLGVVAIGPVVATGFLIAAACAWAAGRASSRLGSTRTFVRMRMLALALLVLLPWMPTFRLAAVVWIIRFALERGSTGAREAVTASLVGERRRARASALSVASLAMPRAAGPIMAGYWIGAGWFAAPFCAAALFQGLYLVLFSGSFSARQENAA
jgi:MFS family permease